MDQSNPDEFDPASLPFDAGSLVHDLTNERFIFRHGHGRGWDLKHPVTSERTIKGHLVAQGVTPTLAAEKIRTSAFSKVYGEVFAPGLGPVVMVENLPRLNAWTVPELVPVSGDWSRVRRILTHLTADDEAGLEWLINWLARRVQFLNLKPRTAAVFTGTPGSGKDTLNAIMTTILGPENCTVIRQKSLESQFNGWALRSLWAFGNEIGKDGANNRAEFMNNLKTLVTERTVVVERKGVDATPERTHFALMIASNDADPIGIAKDCRRFSVFTNEAQLTEEYRAFLEGLHEDASSDFSESFRREIAAFAHHLHQYETNPKLAGREYRNAARAAVQVLSANTVEMFATDLCAGDVGDKWALQKLRPCSESTSTATLAGYTTSSLHQVYVTWSKDHGVSKPYAPNKFGMMLKRAGWTQIREAENGPRGYAPPKPIPDAPATPAKGAPPAVNGTATPALPVSVGASA